MAIVNTTPDSFHEKSRIESITDLDAFARNCLEKNVRMVDIGAHSTRPGYETVSAAQQIERLAPYLERIHGHFPELFVSIDTSLPEVAEYALKNGADIINDVQALQAPGALELLARHRQAGVCLMHMRGEPGTMQQHADYTGDVVQEVLQWLAHRVQAVQAAGVQAQRIVLDPGIGFAKTAAHNLQLLQRQHELQALEFPLLIGWSRKSTLGLITGRPAPQRQAASVAAALLAAQAGASVLRVHDVAATVDALKVWRAATLGKPPEQDRQ